MSFDLRPAVPVTLRHGAFTGHAARGILEWIVQAKTDATRGRRVRQTAELAEQGIRADQWPRGGAPS